MATIRIYRKTDSKAPKMTAKAFANALKILATQDVRVQRPQLLEFLLTGGFASLPVQAPTLAGHRDTSKGWEVPLTDRGRKASKMLAEIGTKPSKTQLAEISDATSDVGTVNSLRLWIEKNLEQFGVDVHSVTVIAE